jgi:citrate lyase subunit beta/citryl-CoA lyase
MTDTDVTPVRSFLFTPANHARRVEKVFEVGADAVILDLEDAVAISEKPAARQCVVEAFSARPQSGTRHYVRVNSIDTPYCEEDIKATVGPWLDGIVLPKVESRSCLNQLERLLAAAETEQGMAVGGLDLMPIIETAAGVESARKIATAESRIKRMAFGGGDYTLDLNYEWNADEAVLAYARAKLSHASRLGDLEPPIDTVVLQIKDDARFLQSARHGKQFGFGGKLCIHPAIRYPSPTKCLRPRQTKSLTRAQWWRLLRRQRPRVRRLSNSTATLLTIRSSIKASGFWRWPINCRPESLVRSTSRGLQGDIACT